MPFEPAADVLVSRCVSIVVCYYHLATTWKDWTSTVLKIQRLSEQFDSAEISFDSIRPLIVARLSERFDPETADRLCLEFTDLIRSIAGSSPATVGQL